MKGIKGEEERLGRGALQQAKKGFSGEKRGHSTPPQGKVKREERGGKGAKKCISLRDKAVRFWAELLGESAVLFS